MQAKEDSIRKQEKEWRVQVYAVKAETATSRSRLKASSPLALGMEPGTRVGSSGFNSVPSRTMTRRLNAAQAWSFVMIMF